jgi:NADPH:quinone reductase-like Zn-dependent oxidoreductase
VRSAVDAGASSPYRRLVRAAVYDRYGSPDVLRIDDVPVPSPAEGQLLVEVAATSVNLSDWESLTGSPFYARLGGLRSPAHRTLGSDLAGRVAEVGPGVTRFRPGDDVYGDNLALMGGFAEYAVAAGSALAPKPAGLSFAEAAALPQAAAIALQGTRWAGPGSRVLINGAGGGSGMYAIQLAKLAGAEVTGVDNAEKQEFMRSLGADHVVDYARENVTRGGRTYDLILDLAAYRSAVAYNRTLEPGGRYLYVGGSVPTLFQVLLIGPLLGLRARKKIRLLPVRLGARQLGPLVELCQQGQVRTVIDRRYPLSEVPEALRYLGAGRAKGKVIITVD